MAVSAALLAQTPEQPVGLVLRSQGGNLLRAGTELALAAKPGDILFAGDSLRVDKGSATFLFCPDNSSQTLGAGGDVTFEARQVRVKAGALADKKPAAFCALPAVPRSADASQFHNGASLTRALKPEADPGTFASRVAALADPQRAALMKELDPIDKAIAADAKDPSPRLARAAVFEKYKLSFDAAEEYKRASELWPDAAWLRTRLFVLEDATEKAAKPKTADPATPGKVYALLVGISKFYDASIRGLNFAHLDADLFYRYLRSDRGGNLPEENIVILGNENATTAAIRNSFETFVKARATKNDTVLLLVASHGYVVELGKKAAYIVTHDSNHEDLAATALPMAAVQKLVQEDLVNVGQVMAFVDICHSGNIGSLPANKRISGVVDRLQETEGQLFLFTASRPDEVSLEGPQFGGGHGAFSFFLMEALNGPGDLNNDGAVSINELIEYTQTKVIEATFDRQHPREGGRFQGTQPMADTKRSGIAMMKYTPVPPGGERSTTGVTLTEASSETRSLVRPSALTGPRLRASVLKEAVDFEEALTAGRILAGGDRNALTALRQLRTRVRPDEHLLQANRLKIMLEDRGQQVLLRYLLGDQVPQTRGDFVTGAAYFATAKQMAPESVFLEAREQFCLGRAALFDKDYQRGQDLLERAVRLDPEGAYVYNALGIAYLEQAVYDKAAQAFREASRRASYWAYPLHNLALTYTQLGDYSAAVRTYEQAVRLAPNYSYLPYNLGLVYQRINRRREAEAAYRRAIELNPKEGMPYNALGYLNASLGRTAEAERLYKQALDLEPNLLVARHNLAVLYAERMKRGAEAVDLWRQNLAKSPDYLPSRLSLAKTLAALNRDAEAVAEYETALKAKPEYVAARLALAEVQRKGGNTGRALANLREVARQQPGNAEVWEAIGDAEKAGGSTAAAAEAYRKALELSVEGGAKKRIRRKMQ